MIIECVNCNKKFNVDRLLIPEKGRQIQCGSCSHIWFYKIEKTLDETLILDKKNIEQEKIIENTQEDTNDINLNIPIPNQTKKETKINDKNINNKNKSIKKSTKSNSIINFFSYLIVIIISFIAFIILLDTLKTPLINIFPILDSFLFNLFETLKDIKLFIIDLT